MAFRHFVSFLSLLSANLWNVADSMTMLLHRVSENLPNDRVKLITVCMHGFAVLYFAMTRLWEDPAMPTFPLLMYVDEVLCPLDSCTNE
jgi:hypothetical protein